jgi:hypothetical protein
VGSPPLFYWISTTNKEVGFCPTKQEIRVLKRRTKEQLATKLPFEE